MKHRRKSERVLTSLDLMLPTRSRVRDDPVVTGVIGFAIGIMTGAALAFSFAWPW